MKKKVSELIGVELDYAVAKCEGYIEERLQDLQMIRGTSDRILVGEQSSSTAKRYEYSPSTNWAQGGPIIDREHIGTSPIFKQAKQEISGEWYWHAAAATLGERDRDWSNPVYGPTLLVAAMRCYVTSKLGSEVEIPEELI